jgi:hypothetical protein
MGNAMGGGRTQESGEEGRWHGRGGRRMNPVVGYSNSETKENDRGILLTERI